MIHRLKSLVRYNGFNPCRSRFGFSPPPSVAQTCIVSSTVFSSTSSVTPSRRLGDSGLFSRRGSHFGSRGTIDSALFERRLFVPGSHFGSRGTIVSGSRRLFVPNLVRGRALHSGYLVSTLVILNDEEGTCVNMLYIVSFSSKPKPSISSKPSPFLLEVCETLSETEFDAIDISVKAFAVWCLFRVLLFSAFCFPKFGAKFSSWANWIDQRRAKAFGVAFVPKVYAQDAAAAKIAKFYAYLVFSGVGMVAGAVGLSLWEFKVEEEVDGLKMKLVDHEGRLKFLETCGLDKEDYTVDKSLLLFIYATVQLYKVFPW